MMSERILVVDDGPEGALEQLLGTELPGRLVLVSSHRPRPRGIGRGVWVSSVPIQQMVPRDGLVHMRCTSDLAWTPEPVCAEILQDLLPPTDSATAFFVVATLLGFTVPATVTECVAVRSWLRARRALTEARFNVARTEIGLVTQQWPEWGPGWALADEIHTRMGRYIEALACRARSEQPPVRSSTWMRQAS